MLRLFYVIEKKMFLSVKQVGTSILWAIFNNKKKMKKQNKTKQNIKKNKKTRRVTGSICMILHDLASSTETTRDFARF